MSPGLAVGLDLLVVLLETDGEAGVSGGVADEVEVVGLGGVQGCAEGGYAGVGDGARGEAGVFVGVVGRGGLEVGGVDGAAPAVVEQGGVDDGGVGGEGHGPGEAVGEDAGDEGAFGLLAYLFFDERGHGDGAGHGGVVDAELGGGLAEAADHGGEDLEGRGVAGEAVGVGEEVAFERFGVGAWGEEIGDEFDVLALGGEEGFAFGEAGGFDCGGDVEDVEALGDGEGLGVDVAADEAVVDLGWWDRVVEAIFAGLEGAVAGEAEEGEGVAAADDAVFPQKGGDGGGAGAGGDVDEGFGCWAVGGVDDVGACC